KQVLHARNAASGSRRAAAREMARLHDAHQRRQVGELQESSRPLPGLPRHGKNAKIRAASELIRRIPAMFIFSIRTVVLAVAASASSLSSAAPLSVQSEIVVQPRRLNAFNSSV